MGQTSPNVKTDADAEFSILLAVITISEAMERNIYNLCSTIESYNKFLKWLEDYHALIPKQDESMMLLFWSFYLYCPCKMLQTSYFLCLEYMDWKSQKIGIENYIVRVISI